jgi:hypothetical protein
MPRLRTDHKGAERVIEKYLRKHPIASGRELDEAMRKKGINPSTFARWNLRNAGKIKVVRAYRLIDKK